jgi:hypothetical protein
MESQPIFWWTVSPEPTCPIISVTWYQAAMYCNWLSEVEGIPESEWCYPNDIREGMKPVPGYLKKKGYRLPTEAEWERACRDGTESSRYFGSSLELLPRYAWSLENANNRCWPVGQKRPNDAGLFDMTGNVWTWTQDAAYAPPTTLVVNDIEDLQAIDDRMNRVMRGGSFGSRPLYIRSAYRYLYRPSNRNFTVGLRPARTYD